MRLVGKDDLNLALLACDDGLALLEVAAANQRDLGRTGSGRRLRSYIGDGGQTFLCRDRYDNK